MGLFLKMESIGKTIKYYRMKKGLSIEGLARILSISPDLVSYWENDEREPSNDLLNELATLFKVDISEFSSNKENASEKKIPVHSSESRGKIIGSCARCGKTIYSADKYDFGKKIIDKKNEVIYQYDAKNKLGYDYFCDNCCKEIITINHQEKELEIEAKEKHNSKVLAGSLLFGLICLAAVVVTSIILYFSIDNNLYAYVICAASLPFGYYMFSLAYSLFMDSNWIHNTVISYMKTSFIILPKKISENDVNDVLKNGIIKAAFLAASYIIAGSILLILIFVFGFCALFMWPSIRRKAKEDIQDRKDELEYE